MSTTAVESKLTIANNLKNNLAYLIKKYNIDNEVLSKCTGVASSTIASLRSRAGNPTILTLQAIADFFNITVDELVNQDCAALDVLKFQNRANNANSTSNNSIIHIPIIELHQVPLWPFSIDNSLKNNQDKFIANQNNINNNCFAVELNSEVLMPSYPKYSLLIIDPQKNITDSAIVLLDLDINNNSNHLTFRQVFIDGGEHYFKPINIEFGSMQQYNSYKIYGTVVRVLQDL